MWIISGPFDVPRPGFDSKKQVDLYDGAFKGRKSKLLKPGNSYTIGRKGNLHISHAKASSYLATISVSPFDPGDLPHPSRYSTVELSNSRDKNVMVLRNGESFSIFPKETTELQNGDEIVAVNSIATILLEWRSLCCFPSSDSEQLPLSRTACISLGIHVVYTSHPDITHHLTSTLALVPATALALLQAQQIVTPAWLAEIIRLGDLPANDDSSNGISLEQEFILPSEYKYRPPFAPMLPVALRRQSFWDPSEERSKMLAKHHFLCVGERKCEIVPDMREVLETGGAVVETFAADGSILKWQKVLATAKSRPGLQLVLLAEEEKIKSNVDVNVWDALVNEAANQGLKFINSNAVLYSIATIDISILDCSFTPHVPTIGESSSRLNNDPNAYTSKSPDLSKPSLTASVPSRRLVRRLATPSTYSIEPSSEQALGSSGEASEQPFVRKPLTRRLGTRDIIVGVDDPSIIDVDPGMPPSSFAMAKVLKAEPTALALPPTPNRSSRLVRRVDASSVDKMGSVVEKRPPCAEEDTAGATLQKFKFLFEQSNPERLSQLANHSGTIDTASTSTMRPTHDANTEVTYAQIQNQKPPQTSLLALPPIALEDVRKEKKEGMQSLIPHITKRTVPVDSDDEMEDGTASRKRQRSEMHDSEAHPNKAKLLSESMKESSNRPGSTTPDKDVEFLRAVASKKKGKKTEDEFDREFNNLRISKPDIIREEEQATWDILADFGDDSNLRGNFMTILDIDVFQKDSTTDGRRLRNASRAEWEGRQDFKKFKRKTAGQRRSPISLFLNVPDDAEIVLQPRAIYSSSSSSLPPLEEPPSKSTAKPRTKKQIYTEVSDEEDVHAESVVPLLRAASRKPIPPLASTTHRVQPNRHMIRRETPQQTLFLASDDDDDHPAIKAGNVGFEMDDDLTEDFANAIAEVSVGNEDEDTSNTLESSTLHSSKSSATRSSGSRPQKGPARASVAPKRKAPHHLMDDDSDDGATFKGFGSRKKTKK